MIPPEGMVERLHRLDVLFERNPIYFVTACTHSRRKILANPDIHQLFLEFAACGPAHGAWLGAYVLMPDHLHAFVSLGHPDLPRQTGHEPSKAAPLLLGTWMKSLKNSISKGLREIKIGAPHWQKGFFDHVLRSGESFSEKWDYVRNNPVRAGLVKHPDDWPYSGQVFPLEFRSEA